MTDEIAAITRAWACRHLRGEFSQSAFARGMLAFKGGGPGAMTSLRPEECAPWEEAALVGGLLLGARAVFDAIMDLPDAEFPFPQGFGNAALGRVFDVLIDAFEESEGTYDLGGVELTDALDRAGLYGIGAVELGRDALATLLHCAAPVFDFDAMTARVEGIRHCALQVRAARLARIAARGTAQKADAPDKEDSQ
jgi:hypothetical protein